METRAERACRVGLERFARFVGPGRLVSDVTPDDFLGYRQKLLRGGLTGHKGLGVHALTRSITVKRDGMR